jgi:hypothetical protein
MIELNAARVLVCPTNQWVNSNNNNNNNNIVVVDVRTSPTGRRKGHGATVCDCAVGKCVWN